MAQVYTLADIVEKAYSLTPRNILRHVKDKAQMDALDKMQSSKRLATQWSM